MIPLNNRSRSIGSIKISQKKFRSTIANEFLEDRDWVPISKVGATEVTQVQDFCVSLVMYILFPWGKPQKHHWAFRFVCVTLSLRSTFYELMVFVRVVVKKRAPTIIASRWRSRPRIERKSYYVPVRYKSSGWFLWDLCRFLRSNSQWLRRRGNRLSIHMAPTYQLDEGYYKSFLERLGATQ